MHVFIQIMLVLYFSYRSREQIQDVRQKRDPINGFKDHLIELDLAAAEEFKVGLE